MKEKKKNIKILLPILLVVLLIAVVGGVTYAFFNYTRTGVANTLQVGRIAFNSTQNNTITLENVFPTATANLNSTNSDTVTITITGDTTYSEGIEYKVTLEDVNNTVNDKEVPISFNVTASNLGTKDTSYYTNRGGENAIYNLTETGQVEDGKYILVGYIPSGATGVNGSIDITAYIDASNIAISDTVSRIDNGNLVYGETPGDWIAGRTVFTTTEWNSFNSNPLSFKVRVEANEGIWVEEPKILVMKNVYNDSNWTNIRANITSIEFHSDGAAPANPLSSFDATDVTSKGTVTVYTVDDGFGNNTYKAIVVADDVIYTVLAPNLMFYDMTNLITFDSNNFKIDKANQIQGLFYNCTSLTNLLGLEKWNTVNLIYTGMLFGNCTNLINVDFLLNWNVSNVEDMNSMFRNCSNLTDFSPLANWNTSSVTNMLTMFGMDSGKSKINDAIIDFSPISNWNVSKVENMGSMFQNVNILSYQAFKNWNVSKVQSFYATFNATNASTVTTLEGLENWDVSSATNMQGMFADNVSLIDASAINNWNINSNVNFAVMFKNTPVHPEFTQVTGTWDSDGTFTPNA